MSQAGLEFNYISEDDLEFLMSAKIGGICHHAWFMGAGDGTQAFMLPRQAPYQLN